MKIAIIGSGISGLTAGYFLHQEHDIHIFEANNWIGDIRIPSMLMDLPLTQDLLCLMIVLTHTLKD